MPEVVELRTALQDEVHVDDTGGSGRPVVLIHGWPLSGESWSEEVPALSEAGYRVVAFSMGGGEVARERVVVDDAPRAST